MTPEAQRIAIAEACGYTDVRREEWEVVDIDARQISFGCYLRGTLFGTRRPVPHYECDLNAMHEAEGKLLQTQTGKYWEELDNACQNPPFLFWVAHATAAQRAEAFLKTIGKWEDSK